MTHADLAVACLLAPLIAFFIALIGLRRRHNAAAAVVILGGLVSLVASLWLLFDAPATPELVTARWFTIGAGGGGGVDLAFGALLDGRALLMAAVVGVITMAVLVYSLGYMRDDPGKGRFFAFLALFEWAMLSFALAPNLLQAFIFWELVGLASFLLIGFWYEKPSAVAAAKKAFIMTRIGDVGLFLGLILLFQDTNTLDILAIGGLFESGVPEALSEGRVELLAGLLFLGVMGKSAQFPLHTWLPDAMEGPTPVSALLHSATMVAAGVFLFARFHELFMAAPAVMSWVLAIALITTLLASTMAIVAQDLKKILAYSSISQLGFMILALAAGGLFAGLFHLATHAVFKALLFLCAGAYIHHHGTNDVVAMGRAGAKKMRATTLGLTAGGLALAGVPIFAGFWSKEAILHQLADHPLFLVGAYVAALLTAYYTFRMLFFIWAPNAASDAREDEPAGAQHHADHHHHGHAAPNTMRGPILVLALGTLVVGLPFVADALGALIGRPGEVYHAALVEMILPVAVVLVGAGLAWLDFGARSAPQRGLVAWFPPVERLFRAGWHLDALYRRTVIRLTDAVASLLHATETRGFDGAGDAVADATLRAGRGAARTHTGQVPLFIGTAVLVLAIVTLSVAFG